MTFYPILTVTVGIMAQLIVRCGGSRQVLLFLQKGLLILAQILSNCSLRKFFSVNEYWKIVNFLNPYEVLSICHNIQLNIALTVQLILV